MSTQAKYAALGLAGAIYLAGTCWAALKGEHAALYTLLLALPGAVLSLRYRCGRGCRRRCRAAPNAP
jgi:hypothetical protein